MQSGGHDHLFSEASFTLIIVPRNDANSRSIPTYRILPPLWCICYLPIVAILSNVCTWGLKILVKCTTSSKQTDAAIYLKLSNESFFLFSPLFSRLTAKHAMLCSKAALVPPKAVLFRIRSTMYRLFYSILSLSFLDFSRCNLLCPPFLPRIMPLNASSSVSGWRGW